MKWTSTALILYIFLNFPPVLYFWGSFSISFVSFIPQLHFPSVLVDHWVLVCVNPLFGTINFFDPVCMTSEFEQQAIMKNVVLLDSFSTLFLKPPYSYISCPVPDFLFTLHNFLYNVICTGYQFEYCVKGAQRTWHRFREVQTGYATKLSFTLLDVCLNAFFIQALI